MRLIFAGTPEAAVPTLARLVASGHEVVAVLTRPDAAIGRRRTLTPSPVATVAEQCGLTIVKANRIDAAVSERLASLDAELGVVVAYGALLREPLLGAPSRGWINLHFSDLPAWRGAAPVQRALIAGEQRIAASVFQLESGLDTGPVLARTERRIAPDDTAGSMLERLADTGADLVLSTVDALADGSAYATQQSGDVSLAPKLTTEDGRLDWHAAAEQVIARWRGTTPEPGAFTTLDGVRIKVTALRALDSASTEPLRPTVQVPGLLSPGALAVAQRRILVGTGTVPVELVRVQAAGRSAMAAADWWRGLSGAGDAASGPRFDSVEPEPDPPSESETGAST